MLGPFAPSGRKSAAGDGVRFERLDQFAFGGGTYHAPKGSTRGKALQSGDKKDPVRTAAQRER